MSYSFPLCLASNDLWMSRIQEESGILNLLNNPETQSDAAFLKLNTYKATTTRNRQIAGKGFISHKAGPSSQM